jgi:CheY-like chemotaxis protein
MVIGGDLHQVISKFSLQEYLLEFATELKIGIKQKYPIYSVTKRRGYELLSISGRRVGDLALTVPQIHLTKNDGSTKELVLDERMPNVLIVDDEHDILLTFKQFLLDQPVNVDVFADPVQLLGRLATVGPSYYDLAILDIKMPKMTGFQVYQMLTALKPNIKTLFVSALDYADEMLSVLRGIDKEHDFIKKPVNREGFLYAVNNKIKLNA